MEKRKHLFRNELDRFLEAARRTRNPARDYCMALVAYRHGLRVTELVELRLDQIDLEAARFTPRRLKRGRNFAHPIEGDEMRALRAWLRERLTYKGACGPYLFLSSQGPMTRQTVNYLFSEIGRKAGLEIRVHPHMLRHTCGFALADQNTATRTIQDYLGHRNIKHTEIYTASNPARFRGLFGGNGGKGGNGSGSNNT